MEYPENRSWCWSLTSLQKLLLRVTGLRFRVQASGFKGFVFRVSGLGVRG